MTPLHEIAKRMGELGLPEKIIDACRNKQAFLFMRGTDGFVLKPEIVGGEVEVLVWVGWGSGGAPARHIEECKRLACLIGAVRLRFHTRRRGFLRVAPRLGFVRVLDDEHGRMVFSMKL
ncbi:MAG: hypothetical protein ACRCXB_08025 [Aeromonadaceae bacterium]